MEDGIGSDGIINLRVKTNVFTNAVRPTMIYGAETWATKKP